jgi:Ring finger domain
MTSHGEILMLLPLVSFALNIKKVVGMGHNEFSFGYFFCFKLGQLLLVAYIFFVRFNVHLGPAVPVVYDTIFWVSAGHMYVIIAILQYSMIGNLIKKWRCEKWIPKIKGVSEVVKKMDQKYKREPNDENELLKFATSRNSSLDNEVGEETSHSCPICYGDFDRDSKISVLETSCGHVFHWECLEEWVVKSNKESCPVCR